MAKSTLDVGPDSNFTLVTAVSTVPNISVSIVDRGGPVAIRASVTVDNPGSNPNTCMVSLAKNGVAIPNSARTLVLGPGTRQNVSLEALDLKADVTDFYTIHANVAATVTPTVLLANQSHVVVEALGQDAAFVAGIGPATP